VGFELSPNPYLSTFRKRFRSVLEVYRKNKALKRDQYILAGGSPRHVKGALAPEHRRESDPASPPQSILNEFIEEAKKVFGINEHGHGKSQGGFCRFIE